MNKELRKPTLDQIVAAKSTLEPEIIGLTREQRKIYGYRLGVGKIQISLIAGCHADEPTGSIFLNHLTNFLGSLLPDHPLVETFQWYLVPYANPDGSHNNRYWSKEADQQFDLGLNLKYAIRELPGDDIEFGFPTDSVKSMRPENDAIYGFWKSANSKFNLHVSVHGMRISYGPWFLIDKDFISEVAGILAACKHEVELLRYHLHDVERKGEKGFFRFEPGFGSRPDSEAMKQHFRDLGDNEMAKRFHPSSMESIRSLGDPCLTLVTEMPLFIVPKDHSGLPWPDPTLSNWTERMNQWKLDIEQGQKNTRQVTQEASDLGLRAMPIRDQMHLQWTFIWSGIVHQLSQVDQ